MRPVLGSEQSRMCHIEQNNILAKSFFLMAALTYLGCTHEDNMTIEQGYIIYIEIIYIYIYYCSETMEMERQIDLNAFIEFLRCNP